LKFVRRDGPDAIAEGLERGDCGRKRIGAGFGCPCLTWQSERGQRSDAGAPQKSAARWGGSGAEGRVRHGGEI